MYVHKREYMFYAKDFFDGINPRSLTFSFYIITLTLFCIIMES